eukprot:TRINITY_DN47724_c0_g1_i2.p1 TRINITY_DN47724_c0_g1~~TRINITY_DN47724_c0_g1_i2.p1  ORF type:complete len:177 (-),score=35.06 TRINITY_DN47724_c0_g1_i2:181-711(-)
MAARSAAPNARWLQPPWWLVLFLVAANLPDVDLLVGLAFGNFGRFHGGPTHSLLFASAAVLVAAVVLPATYRRMLPWLAIAVFSHLLIDMLSGSVLGWSQSYGTRLLWPFDDDRIRAPFSLFLGVENSTGGNLLTAHNVFVVCVEVVSFLPLLLGFWWLARSREARVATSPGAVHE